MNEKQKEVTYRLGLEKEEERTLAGSESHSGNEISLLTLRARPSVPNANLFSWMASTRPMPSTL